MHTDLPLPLLKREINLEEKYWCTFLQGKKDSALLHAWIRLNLLLSDTDLEVKSLCFAF